MVPAWLQARGCHCHGAVGTLPLTFHVDRGTVAFQRLRVGHRRDLGLLDFPSRLGCPRSGSCSTVTSLSQTCPLPPQPNLAREPRGKLAWRPWAFPLLSPPCCSFHSHTPPLPHPVPCLFSFMSRFCYLAGEGMATNPVTSACPAAHICHALASVPGNPSESYLPQMRPCRILCIFTTLASQLPLLTFVSPRYRIGLSPHTFLHLFCLKQLS